MLCRRRMEELGQGYPMGRKIELTNREIAVMRLLIGGLSSKAVGDYLGLPREAVERDIKHAYGKLDVDSGTDAAIKLLQGPQRDLFLYGAGSEFTT